jgi:class 3 adenylate cyclase
MLVIVGLLCGTVMLYFVLAEPDHRGQKQALAVGIYGLILVPTSGVMAWVVSQPLRRLQRAIDDGVDVRALPAADIIAALRIPLHLVRLIIGIGVVVAVVFAVIAAENPDAWAAWYIYVFGGLSVTVISASAHAYAQRWIVINDITPVLLPHGRLDHLGDAPLTPTWMHLMGLTATLGIAWPTLGVVVMKFGPELRPSAALVMFALYLLLSAHQCIGILSSIARPIGHLRDRMIEVGSGVLLTQARIDGLDTFGRLASEFNRMVDGLRQRDLLKETFGRYVTTQVADEILAGRVALGGERRTATVLFSDIRGFTAISEQLPPEDVVSFLNEYLTMMVDCVAEHGGVLDKFIGDAVLAVFGVPVGSGSVQQDAIAAVACAQAMGGRLEELNARRAARGASAIRIGIGLHTGALVAGNIGSPKRMQYTVIGDTVNVGARLESLTKEHGRRILLSGSTASLVSGVLTLQPLGTVSVRGRQEPLALFGVEENGAPSPHSAVAGAAVGDITSGVDGDPVPTPHSPISAVPS